LNLGTEISNFWWFFWWWNGDFEIKTCCIPASPWFFRDKRKNHGTQATVARRQAEQGAECLRGHVDKENENGAEIMYFGALFSQKIDAIIFQGR